MRGRAAPLGVGVSLVVLPRRDAVLGGVLGPIAIGMRSNWCPA